MIVLPAEAERKPSFFPSASRFAMVGLGLIALSVLSSLINKESLDLGSVSVLWLSNGFLIGALLCSPRRQWPIFFLLGYGTDTAVNLWLKTPVVMSCYLSLCNMTEVAIAAFLMYPAIKENPDLTGARQLKSLLLYGALLAPAVASMLASFYLRKLQLVPYSESLQFWFAADVLGIATMTPLYLSFHHRRAFSHRSKVEVFGLFLLVCVGAVVVFRQTEYPALWVILLCLLLLGVRLGFTASAAGLLLVLFIGGYYTVMGHGPMGLMTHVSLARKILVFQLFVLSTLIVLYVTEVVIASGARLSENLRLSESRFRLLAESSRDVIVLSDPEGRRQYVSPAVTELMGWLPEEMVGEHYSQNVHPDDLDMVGKHLESIREGRDDRVLTYRARHKDGSYQWLEATVRLLLDNKGQHQGYVYSVRDISSRKAIEEERAQAFELVERRAMVDGLTGVANRHRLDQTLDMEWRRAVEGRISISLLLIDVDHFKAFNDIYGHLAGDDCLRLIARTIQGQLHRTGDLLARYGGEEFVVVLPETATAGAETVSEQIREAVEATATPHLGNPYGVVTVSIGCATEVPMDTMHWNSLLRAADEALYQAKSNGRNRMQVAGSGDAGVSVS